MMLRHFSATRVIALFALFCTSAAFANVTVLYDRAGGGLPLAQGWLAGGPIFGTAVAGADGTTITTATGDYGGYANHFSTLTLFPALQVGVGALVNPAFPTLDPASGFDLTWTFRLDGEDHSGNPNRAGFSVTLIGANTKGIEVGFQSNRIFAQNDASGGGLFTAGENTTDAATIALLSDFNTWTLSIGNSGYVLKQGGTDVLAGSLRDYSGYVGLGQDAYRTANFLFLGDNTTSAGAQVTLRDVAVSAVPEPEITTLLFVGLGLIAAMRNYRRR